MRTLPTPEAPSSAHTDDFVGRPNAKTGELDWIYDPIDRSKPLSPLPKPTVRFSRRPGLWANFIVHHPEVDGGRGLWIPANAFFRYLEKHAGEWPGSIVQELMAVWESEFWNVFRHGPDPFTDGADPSDYPADSRFNWVTGEVIYPSAEGAPHSA